MEAYSECKHFCVAGGKYYADKKTLNLKRGNENDALELRVLDNSKMF